MQLRIETHKGWIYVGIGKATPWHRSNFFALVDTWYEKIREAYERDRRPIVFDLSDLAQVDSILTSLIIRTVRMADEHRNALIAPNAEIRGIMALLGIDKLIEVFESYAEWRSETAGTDTGRP